MRFLAECSLVWGHRDKAFLNSLSFVVKRTQWSSVERLRGLCIYRSFAQNCVPHLSPSLHLPLLCYLKKTTVGVSS